MRWLLLPAAYGALPSAWASASKIASARLWPADEYTRVIFESAAPIEHQLVVLADPQRLVLDLARIDASPALEQLASLVQPSDPYIARIRIGTPAGGFLRVVLDLKTEVRPQVFSLAPVAEYGHRLVVDLYPVNPVDPLMALLQGEGVGVPAAPDTRATASPRDERRHAQAKVPARRITVAIDPGHGGEDPGAIGRRGTYEKNVVLAIGRKLSKVLTTDARLRVMMTRNDDYYLPLAERVRKARRLQADLFVSIHADAFR
jgi:N-acetylmuramoyl-L-alanine amidase